MDNFENNKSLSAQDTQNSTDNFLNEDWISLSTPIATEHFNPYENLQEQESAQSREPKKKFSVKSPVLTLQLFACLSFLLFLFISKAFLPDVFTAIKTFYDRELSATMFSDGDFSSIDYSSFFASTEDEA